MILRYVKVQGPSILIIITTTNIGDEKIIIKKLNKK